MIEEVLGGRGETSFTPTRRDFRMIATAMDKGYPISADIRRLVVNKAALIVLNSPSVREQLAAMKVIVAADQVNARRETNQISEKHNDVLAATAVLRAAMQSPEVRERMARESDAVCELPLPSAASVMAEAVSDDLEAVLAEKVPLNGDHVIFPKRDG